MTNHKGGECPYKKITCIEGICDDCEVKIEYDKGYKSRAAVDENKINGEKCKIQTK